MAVIVNQGNLEIPFSTGNKSDPKAVTLRMLDLPKQGFLGTTAPRYADVVLLLEIGMGLVLVIGAVLARKKMFRLHARCQSTVVLLNLAIVVLVMVPSFQVHVGPRLPAKLGKAYYTVATAHAALGSLTEMAGLYILLAVGTKMLPQQLRLTRYKEWMRTVLVLWWLVILLGLMTYIRWYVPQNLGLVFNNGCREQAISLTTRNE